MKRGVDLLRGFLLSRESGRVEAADNHEDDESYALEDLGAFVQAHPEEQPPQAVFGRVPFGLWVHLEDQTLDFEPLPLQLAKAGLHSAG